jgi:hypothetical protein
VDVKPWLVVEVDRTRGLAAVRGAEARRVAKLLSSVEPRWSSRGRGWLVPAVHADDVSAYAQTRHEWALVYNRKDG